MAERPSPSHGPARRGDPTRPPSANRPVRRGRISSRRAGRSSTTTSPDSDRGRRRACALTPEQSVATGHDPAALPLSVWLLESTTAREFSAEIRALALAAFAPTLTVRARSRGTTAPGASPAPRPRASTAELEPAPDPCPSLGRDSESGPLITDADAGPESLPCAVCTTGTQTTDVASPGGARREEVSLGDQADTAESVRDASACAVQVAGGASPMSPGPGEVAALDFVLVAICPRHAVGAVDLGAAAARLRPGGVLVAVTDRHRDGSRLIDARPGVVVAAQRAGLDYLQHIVTVLPPRPCRALGPDVSVFRRPVPPHSTRTTRDAAPADTAPTAESPSVAAEVRS